MYAISSRLGVLRHLLVLTLTAVAIAGPLGQLPRQGALNPQPLPPRKLPLVASGGLTSTSHIIVPRCKPYQCF